MKFALVAASLFVLVTVAGCGNSGSPSSAPPPKSHSSKSHSSTSGSSSSAKVSGFCGYINGAKTQVNNLKSLGKNPSMNTLTADLNNLQTKLHSGASSASATVKPGFIGVEKADSAMKTAIAQLKSSGLPSSSYEKPVKDGVAAIATSFDALVAVSKCA